jgi:hypothetical protein
MVTPHRESTAAYARPRDAFRSPFRIIRYNRGSPDRNPLQESAISAVLGVISIPTLREIHTNHFSWIPLQRVRLPSSRVQLPSGQWTNHVHGPRESTHPPSSHKSLIAQRITRSANSRTVDGMGRPHRNGLRWPSRPTFSIPSRPAGAGQFWHHGHQRGRAGEGKWERKTTPRWKTPSVRRVRDLCRLPHTIAAQADAMHSQRAANGL